jgi:transposase InsO family protein
LKEVGITPSMGRTRSALDNAMAESFVSNLKAELASRLKFPSRQDGEDGHLRVPGNLLQHL